MSNLHDKLDISLTSYENECWIRFEKIDIEKGQVVSFNLDVDEDVLKELSAKFELNIDTLPF